jgi:hypothetical protein
VARSESGTRHPAFALLFAGVIWSSSVCSPRFGQSFLNGSSVYDQNEIGICKEQGRPRKQILEETSGGNRAPPARFCWPSKR